MSLSSLSTENLLVKLNTGNQAACQQMHLTITRERHVILGHSSLSPRHDAPYNHTRKACAGQPQCRQSCDEDTLRSHAKNKRATEASVYLTATITDMVVLVINDTELTRRDTVNLLVCLEIPCTVILPCQQSREILWSMTYLKRNLVRALV